MDLGRLTHGFSSSYFWVSTRNEDSGTRIHILRLCGKALNTINKSFLREDNVYVPENWSYDFFHHLFILRKSSILDCLDIFNGRVLVNSQHSSNAWNVSIFSIYDTYFQKYPSILYSDYNQNLTFSMK